jgi:hypothetical protein
MKRIARISLTAAAPLLVSLLLNVVNVVAGPPLLCHPIEIGDATSLPWGDGTWQNEKIELTDADFVAQTLAILSTDAMVLTRMETIRRAAIHAAERPKAAANLMSAVRLRVSNDDTPVAMHHFDLGYIMAAYEQMNIVTEHNATGITGGHRSSLSVPEGLNAYDLLEKAAKMAPRDAAIEFALALVTLSPSRAAHKKHLQNAISGAPEGSLLATNLVRRFGQDGQSLSTLKSSFGMAADGERR